MITDLESAIKHYLELAEENKKDAEQFKRIKATQDMISHCYECAEEHRQLAEWLRELKAYREFVDWLAEAVLAEDWEDDSDFYAEVLCRKLTKLGKLKVVDNKYMEVNADETNRCEN